MSGSVCVLSRKCCILVSLVHPVAILNAAFRMNCVFACLCRMLEVTMRLKHTHSCSAGLLYLIFIVYCMPRGGEERCARFFDRDFRSLSDGTPIAAFNGEMAAHQRKEITPRFVL